MTDFSKPWVATHRFTQGSTKCSVMKSGGSAWTRDEWEHGNPPNFIIHQCRWMSPAGGLVDKVEEIRGPAIVIEEPPTSWALVELLGHKRFVAQVYDDRGGTRRMRVLGTDYDEVEIGESAIFRITYVNEARARSIAASLAERGETFDAIESWMLAMPTPNDDVKGRATAPERWRWRNGKGMQVVLRHESMEDVFVAFTNGGAVVSRGHIPLGVMQTATAEFQRLNEEDIPF